MTKVVNLKRESFDIFIGRPSAFGNPFIIGRDGDRNGVIELYRRYFHRRISTDGDFRVKVSALKGKVLGCYCKPLPCHGDVIAEYLDGNSEAE